MPEVTFFTCSKKTYLQSVRRSTIKLHSLALSLVVSANPPISVAHGQTQYDSSVKQVKQACA